jgi:hypothetical protein
LSPTGLSSPPRAHLAFRVGVVGHRPDRLPKDAASLEALRQMLRCVLEDTRSAVTGFLERDDAKLYSSEPFVLRAVSPLAEGADQIFGELAVALGFELLCPMPFYQEEFEKDFAPPTAMSADALQKFRGILARARSGSGLTVFELDGDRSNVAVAYGTAGRVVMSQSDLLVVVWDGEPAKGGGGTIETLREAVRYNVPVLWIDALAPHSWQLLRSEADLDCLDSETRCRPSQPFAVDAPETRAALADSIRTIVVAELGLLPENGKGDTAKDQATQFHVRRFFDDRKPRYNFFFVWKLFRDLVGSSRIRRPTIKVPDFESEVAHEWPVRSDPVGKGAGATPPPSDVEDWVNRRLRPHFAWADRRGDIYADSYRSAFVLIYLLSSFAVFLALLPIALHSTSDKPGRLWIVTIELLFVVAIFATFLFSRRHQWHERWMEHRLIAELIRQIRFLIPLGGGRPFPYVPVHLSGYGGITRSWMFWHVRAIARATGVPQARITPAYIADCLSYLEKVVEEPSTGQISFHRNSERRSKRISHLLHATSSALFLATIFVILFHLGVGVLEFSFKTWVAIREFGHKVDGWLVLLAATLPALGAALAGIANQGEFARLARRSSAMADAFEEFASEIEGLKSTTSAHRKVKLAELIPVASKIAEVMVDEVTDWRAVIIEQPVRTV